MGAMSRRKGASGEREAIAILRHELGLQNLERRLEQWRSGGSDVVGLEAFGWSVEIKRAKQWLNSWWEQAVEQGHTEGRMPVLIYRLDRKQWMARMRAADLVPELTETGDSWWVEMELGTWCQVARERMSGGEGNDE
jgi:hypothetical protein